ncbi:MAG: hypothetical protein AAFZ01_07775, partial [Pseudomonadota bacterium]
HIAEPGALIGFAGPRVIEQTIREQLPEGFQRSEYLLEHGMVDMVVHRHDMRDTLARVCRLLMKEPARAAEHPAVQAHANGLANGVDHTSDHVANGHAPDGDMSADPPADHDATSADDVAPIETTQRVTPPAE